jgi:hypothetical protein
MKSKPMLLRKLSLAKQNSNREAIGLIGTHHGTGTTYTGLMLAFYMGEVLGRKTAYLECNRHHDMALIQASYDWSSQEDNSFTFHLVSCYKEVTKEQVSRIYNKNFDCILFDFGTDFAANREEFLRCTTKIVVAGRSEWDQLKMIRFADTTKTIQGSDSWIYFIPQANSKTVRKMESEAAGKVFSVPFTEEPVLPSREIRRFFDNIF